MEKKLVTRAREKSDLICMKRADIRQKIVAAKSDGIVSPDEWADIEFSLLAADAIHDEAHALLEAADAAEAVCDMVRRASRDERYRKAVLNAWFCRLDELPETAA